MKIDIQKTSQWLLLADLFRYLSINRFKNLSLLFIIIIIATIAELIAIAVSVPFISMIINPSGNNLPAFSLLLLNNLGLNTTEQYLVATSIALGASALIAGISRVTLLSYSTRFAFLIGSDISQQIYTNIVNQPYKYHTATNSSSISDAIISKSQNLINGILYPLIHMISASLMLSAIFSTFLIIQTYATMAALLTFASIYVAVYYVLSPRLRMAGQLEAANSAARNKHIQESLGGIRDIIIDQNQTFYSQIFRSAEEKLRTSQAAILVLTQSPRFIIEAIGMILIAALAYGLTETSESLSSALPIVGALALAAQRMLPMLQQIYGGFASIKGNHAALSELLKMMEAPERVEQQNNSPKLHFSKNIKFGNLGFSYPPNNRPVLVGVNLVIQKGQRVGIVGESGSGKSTLIDILLGLLEPTDGDILIDDIPITRSNIVEWQSLVSHVPQTVYLADCSIIENIAFGEPTEEIRYEHAIRAATIAEIDRVIRSLPQGYHTKVGERGVMLSGGQRQRLGIARALYKSKEILVLDEATSALDEQTEKKLLENIRSYSKDVTILCVSHRESTLVMCDTLIKIENGSVIEVRK